MENFSERTLRNAPAFKDFRVKVTIIDTGIHAAHPYVDENWSHPDARSSLFRDFSKRVPGDDQRGEPSATEQDEPVDEDGHGTFIAGLLLRLVPNIELSIARIGTKRDEIRKDEHLGYKVGKAIKYAVENWESEIISISFGCEGSKFAIKPLRDAINKDVIVLAATSNSGDSEVLRFPANEDRVFKIYSSTTFAKEDEMTATPDDTKNSFHTLGRAIESIWPVQLASSVGKEVQLRCKTAEKKRKRNPQREHSCSEKCDTWTVMSGTSFSTPIAAAMVAMVYQFHNTHRDMIVKHKKEDAEDLKTITSVRHILTRMSTRVGKSPILYLQPPRQNTGSHFYFEPDAQPKTKTGEGGAGKPEDEKDVYGQTYEEFFRRRLTEAINDGGRIR
ncbi:peptidase S8/S53 domain-containing protein [Ilyonectria sp. MPI-CAGE-AT-0026]|nr:peptidase S8/S53 domain-containing protein [Ilyonectria sp. MPI-CAGE-AT-0026]